MREVVLKTPKGFVPRQDVFDDVIQFTGKGLEFFCDNFYSNPALFTDLAADGITVMATLRTNRQGIPADVLQSKNALNKSNVETVQGITSDHQSQSWCTQFGRTIRL